MGAVEINTSGALPAGVSAEAAIKLLHDHVGFFQAATHYRSHEEVADSGADHAVPADIKARAVGDVKVYKVVNEVPNKVFDSSVSSEYEVLSLNDGIWYRAKSPMGVVNVSVWSVADGKLSAHIDVECTVLLKPVVKGQVETSSQDIINNLIAKMA